jgi:TonB family protein
MTTALLYRPGSKWRVALAFGVAGLVHIAAVGFASMQHKPIEQEITIGGDPEVVFEPNVPQKIEDSPPPPEMVESSPPPAFPDDSVSEERSTPPPVHRAVTKPAEPVHRDRIGIPGLTTLTAAKVFATSAPRPDYPYEARRSKITGQGVIAMTIDSRSGYVTEVSLVQSTGSPYLDNAAATAFRRWRFKPGTVARVRCPITFTLTGASY